MFLSPAQVSKLRTVALMPVFSVPVSALDSEI
jgi:hypothetical protein